MDDYEALKAALIKTGIPFKEDGWAGDKPTPFGVYAIDMEGASLHSDDHIYLQVLSGSVDVFTKGEGYREKGKIEQALDEAEVSWYFSSRQFEEDTNLTHLEWVFEIMAVPGEEA